MHLEERLPSLLPRYDVLTIQTFVRVLNSPVVHRAGSSYEPLSSYLLRPWHRPHVSQVVFIVQGPRFPAEH